jgi:hypothetical protein
MTKMQFQAAAARVQGEIDEEIEDGDRPEPKTLEFSLAGQDFELYVPTTTQIILLSTSTDEGTLRAMLSASMAFLEGIMIGDGYKRFRKLVANGTISNDLLLGGDGTNEQGIIDWIISQVTDARPTTSSTDSSPSPASTGKRSTGRAPGKGSIPSGSQ